MRFSCQRRKHLKLLRIFSVKRMALSAALGFLLPLGYVILLSEVSDYSGRTPPDFLVMTFLWPRPLWVLLMGEPRSDSDIIVGVVFLAVCNTVAYGTAVYVTLSMFFLARKTQAGYQSPPVGHEVRPHKLEV
jgi:hypothetical protein